MSTYYDPAKKFRKDASDLSKFIETLSLENRGKLVAEINHKGIQNSTNRDVVLRLNDISGNSPLLIAWACLESGINARKYQPDHEAAAERRAKEEKERERLERNKTVALGDGGMRDGA